MKRFRTQHFQVLLLLISVTIFASTLWKRVIHIDDIWLGEYSYWLNKLGYVKSEALRGFLDVDNKLFVYHKIFNLEGAWLIHWFGFNPYILKSLSLGYVALSLSLLAILYNKISDTKTNWLLAIAIFISFFHTVNLGFTFRPEMNMVFLGLGSYLLLSEYFKSEKLQFLFAAAFLIGLSIATHLNGVVYAGASVLLLWLHRKWLAGFILGAIASWGLVFFVTFDTQSMNDVRTLYLQLTQWRDVSTGKYGWESFFRIFQEQERYLHSPPEIIYSLMLLALIIPARKYFSAEQKRLFYYIGLLSLCVAQVTHGTNTNYLMYAFPFFVLLAVSSFEILIARRRQALAWSAVMMFLTVSWTYNISKFQHRETSSAELEKLVAFIPAGASVLAPPKMIFTGLGHQRIQVFVNYRDKVEKQELEQSPEALFAEAANYQNSYVILDDSNAAFFKVKNQDYGAYTLLTNSPSESYKVYQLKTQQ